MNRTILLLLSIFTVFHAFAFGADKFREPSDVISKEGQLCITDGSSIYTFKRDGTFELGPVGMSGPWIKGTWKPRKDNDRFIEVEGEWRVHSKGFQKDGFGKKSAHETRPEANRPSNHRGSAPA